MRHLRRPSRHSLWLAPVVASAAACTIASLTATAVACAIAGAIANAMTSAPLAAQSTAQPTVSPPATSPPAAPPSVVEGDPYTVVRPTLMRSAPEATRLAQLERGTAVEVLARDRGWVRIRTEGWVRESDLISADTALRSALSAADLRADPVAARGKIVQWTVEFLALQTADPLRQGMADQEPYILARGPGMENAILYLVVPPSLMSTARALQALSKIAITARVRDGRSEPTGIPILDLQSIRRLK